MIQCKRLLYIGLRGDSNCLCDNCQCASELPTTPPAADQVASTKFDNVIGSDGNNIIQVSGLDWSDVKSRGFTLAVWWVTFF